MKTIFFLVVICILFVSCSQSEEASPEPTIQPSLEADIIQEQPAETASQKEGLTGLADIRVVDIEVVTNARGIITDQGCSGPRVDLIITISNFGQDFPSDQMWEEWVDLIENSNVVDIPLEERSVFDVYTKVYFHGKDKGWSEFRIPVLPKDITNGKFPAGKTMKFDYSVDVTTWDGALEKEYVVVSTIRQSSGVLPIETHNLLFEDSFPLDLPDITVQPGAGRLVPKDPGDGRPITGSLELRVDNIGSAPTTGPVQMGIIIKNPDGVTIAIWEATIKEPFSGSQVVYLLDEEMKAAPIKGAKATINLYMLCPSEQYATVSDFDQSNNRVIRDAY